MIVAYQYAIGIARPNSLMATMASRLIGTHMAAPIIPGGCVSNAFSILAHKSWCLLACLLWRTPDCELEGRDSECYPRGHKDGEREVRLEHDGVHVEVLDGLDSKWQA